jgi:hypothetical protein
MPGAAALNILDSFTAPTGSFFHFSPSIGNINGVDHTVLGEYVLRQARSLEGGVPVAAWRQFVIVAADLRQINAQAPITFTVGAVNVSFVPWLLGSFRRKQVITFLYGVDPARVLNPGLICQAIISR